MKVNVWQYILPPKFRELRTLSCSSCSTELDHDEDPAMLEFPAECFNCGSTEYSISSKVQRRYHRFQLWR